MQKPKGHIKYRKDTLVSYSYGGRNPARDWVVVIDRDPVNMGERWQGNVVTTETTYERAASKLAAELAWRDPKVFALKEKAKALEREIYAREYERLIAEGGTHASDQDLPLPHGS